MTDYTMMYSNMAQPSPAVVLTSLAFSIFLIVCNWKLFKKANLPGWGAIVPIYNGYLLFKMIYGNGWRFLLLLIPIVNIVIAILCMFDLAKVFGKSTGFGFGLLFLSMIFIPILALDNSEYVGPKN